MIKPGTWGKLASEEGAGGEAAGLSDPSFEVPVILLDVDDTIPKFKSVVEAEYGSWDGED